MSDAASNLSEQDFADLCALADGTLAAERRPVVEARVAASPELQRLVERQRQAMQATRALAEEPVPPSLRAAVEASRPARARGRPAPRLLPRLALAGGLALVLVAVLAVFLTGGPGAPTVAEAAQLAQQPPTGPAPATVDPARTRLDVDVEGVVFPAFERGFGWHAVGTRREKLGGRNVVVVVYEKGSRRIGYAIVGGSALTRPGNADGTTRGGVLYQTLELDGKPVVTWRRDGHTCVLVGGASRDELLALAAY
jgi:anti-sigma factor RsiW